jgi:DNA-binding beta-propeller fold protein YncE
VTVGTNPAHPVFDGTNIWVPNLSSSSVTVLRGASGAVLATLTGNGLNHPNAAAFDGERVLVANLSGDKVSVFKAADVTPIGSFPIAAGQQIGACSDGINFWVAVGSNPLVRF